MTTAAEHRATWSCPWDVAPEAAPDLRHRVLLVGVKWGPAYRAVRQTEFWFCERCGCSLIVRDGAIQTVPARRPVNVWTA